MLDKIKIELLKLDAEQRLLIVNKKLYYAKNKSLESENELKSLFKKFSLVLSNCVNECALYFSDMNEEQIKEVVNSINDTMYTLDVMFNLELIYKRDSLNVFEGLNIPEQISELKGPKYISTSVFHNINESLYRLDKLYTLFSKNIESKREILKNIKL